MVEECVEPKPKNFQCGKCNNIVPYNDKLTCSMCDVVVEE